MHDEVASVPDDLPASLDGQATQDEILPFLVSGRPDYESSTPAPSALCRVVADCYEELVQWKRNNFLIPSGSAGKAFMDEVAGLFQSYADNDTIAPIAFKACIHYCDCEGPVTLACVWYDCLHVYGVTDYNCYMLIV